MERTWPEPTTRRWPSTLPTHGQTVRPTSRRRAPRRWRWTSPTRAESVVDADGRLHGIVAITTDLQGSAELVAATSPTPPRSRRWRRRAADDLRRLGARGGARAELDEAAQTAALAAELGDAANFAVVAPTTAASSASRPACGGRSRCWTPSTCCPRRAATARGRDPAAARRRSRAPRRHPGSPSRSSSRLPDPRALRAPGAAMRHDRAGGVGAGHVREAHYRWDTSRRCVRP